MPQNYQNRVLQNAFAIQGLKLKISDEPTSPLPIFTVSSRRIVTETIATILEQGTTNDEFDEININSKKLKNEQNIALIKFKVVTDFWYGFGSMELSNVTVLTYPHSEELEQIRWNHENEEISPIVDFSTYSLTKNGKQH